MFWISLAYCLSMVAHRILAGDFLEFHFTIVGMLLTCPIIGVVKADDSISLTIYVMLWQTQLPSACWSTDMPFTIRVFLLSIQAWVASSTYQTIKLFISSASTISVTYQKLTNHSCSTKPALCQPAVIFITVLLNFYWWLHNRQAISEHYYCL